MDARLREKLGWQRHPGAARNDDRLGQGSLFLPAAWNREVNTPASRDPTRARNRLVRLHRRFVALAIDAGRILGLALYANTTIRLDAEQKTLCRRRSREKGDGDAEPRGHALKDDAHRGIVSYVHRPSRRKHRRVAAPGLQDPTLPVLLPRT